MKISNCCGYEIGDPHFIDIGICPDCKEHCDFEEVNEEEEETQKTALMELIEWIDDYYELNKCAPNVHYTIKKATELLQNERQQIEDAWSVGGCETKGSENILTASDYYNKTYKQWATHKKPQ